MRWSVREIYYYGVSFVTLMVILFGAITFANGLLAFWEPPYAPDSVRLAQIEQRLINERRQGIYPRAIEPMPGEARMEVPKPIPGQSADDAAPRELTPEEREAIRADARQELELEKRRERFFRVRGLTQSGVAILVAAGFYLYHWRRAKQTEAAAG